MSLRARAIWIAATILLFLWSALGTLMPNSPLAVNDGLNLGLDLQGGIHWMFQVDLATAEHQEMQRVLGQIQQRAEELGVPIAHSELREDHVIVLAGDAERLTSLVEDEIGEDLDVEEVGGQLEVSLGALAREDVHSRAVEQAISVIRERIDSTGVTEPTIQKQGKGRILVQLPGDEIDRDHALALIRQVTFLEFKKVLQSAPNVEILQAAYPSGLPPDTQIVCRRSDALGGSSAPESEPIDGSDAAEPAPEAGDAEADGAGPCADPGNDRVVEEAFLVPVEPILTGDCLDDARARYGQTVGQPVVAFKWKRGECTESFADFTGSNIGERLAAIIDGWVVTAPSIRARIRGDGVIEGMPIEEAARVAISLRSGALPIPIEVAEERTVGPTLGADSIRAGLRSIVIGALLVVAFMIVYYRLGGAFADVALVANIVLILGVMSLMRATLTLPGIAGLVLTVGMAVDANVIIFERIREELRSGKVARTAALIGFRRSAITIVDANVTTLIAAVALYYFGSGPVQGFGVTLAVGIVTSMFSALLVTRLLFDLVLARNAEGVKI